VQGLRVGLVFAAGVFGIACAALFVRFALPAPPVVTGFYRMGFASFVLVLVWLIRRAAGRAGATADRRGVGLALAAGACFGTDIGLWHSALVRTSVANATLLVNTTPIHVGLFTALVLRAPLGRHFAPGAALATAGAAVLLGIGADAELALRGDLLALCAALFYAAYLLCMVAARPRIDALSAVTLMSLAAAAVLGVGGWLRGDAFSGFPAHAWLSMLGAAFVSQIGGAFGIVWALRYMPAPFASVALLGQVVMASALAWAVLGEALDALQLAGGGAVLAGIAIVSLGSRQPGAAPPPPDGVAGRLAGR